MAITKKKSFKKFPKKSIKKRIYKANPRPRYQIANPKFARYALDYQWLGRIDGNAAGTAEPGALVSQLRVNTSCYGYPAYHLNIVEAGEPVGSTYNTILNADGTAPSTGNAKLYAVTTGLSGEPPMDIAIRDQFRTGRCIGVSYTISLINNGDNTNVDCIVMQSNSVLYPTRAQLQNPITWSKLAGEKYTKERALTGPGGASNKMFLKDYISNFKIRGRTRKEFQADDQHEFNLPTTLTDRSVPAKNNYLLVWIRATQDNGGLVYPDVKFALSMRYYYEFYNHRTFTV